MADSINYLIYPAVANDFSFPPAVRQAIANAPELKATYADKVQTQTAINNLELDSDEFIDGGTP